MRDTDRNTTSFGKTGRCLALLTLALFLHAVAVHLLHAHEISAKAFSCAPDGVVSTPHDAPANEQHSSEHCPACQLQHGFAFLEATPALLCLDETAPATASLAPLRVTLRFAEGSGPSRAPPAI